MASSMMLVMSLLVAEVSVEFTGSLVAFAYIKRHVREGAIHVHNKRGNHVPVVCARLHLTSAICKAWPLNA
jgi:hypothetical protein